MNGQLNKEDRLRKNLLGSTKFGVISTTTAADNNFKENTFFFNGIAN